MSRSQSCTCHPATGGLKTAFISSTNTRTVYSENSSVSELRVSQCSHYSKTLFTVTTLCDGVEMRTVGFIFTCIMMVCSNVDRFLPYNLLPEYITGLAGPLWTHAHCSATLRAPVVNAQRRNTTAWFGADRRRWRYLYFKGITLYILHPVGHRVTGEQVGSLNRVSLRISEFLIRSNIVNKARLVSASTVQR